MSEEELASSVQSAVRAMKEVFDRTNVYEVNKAKESRYSVQENAD